MIAPLSCDQGMKVTDGIVQRLIATHPHEEIRASGIHARKIQQVMDQSLHALRAIHDEFDELIGVALKLAPVALAPATERKSIPCAAAPASRGWRRRQTAATPRWSASARSVRSRTRSSRLTFNCRICSSVFLRSLMSRMALVMTTPSSVCRGLKLISTGNGARPSGKAVNSTPRSAGLDFTGGAIPVRPGFGSSIPEPMP